MPAVPNIGKIAYGSRPPILHTRRPHPVTLAGRKVAYAARIQVMSAMARFSAILNPETREARHPWSMMRAEPCASGCETDMARA